MVDRVENSSSSRRVEQPRPERKEAPREREEPKEQERKVDSDDSSSGRRRVNVEA